MKQLACYVNLRHLGLDFERQTAHSVDQLHDDDVTGRTAETQQRNAVKKQL